MTLLQARGLRVTLPGVAAPVLTGINLDIARGEKVGLVGESGSGKTMLALALMALLPQGARAEGTIVMDRVNLLTASETALTRHRGNRAGMVFQEPMTALDPLMRIDDQVAEPLRLHRRLPRKQARAAAAALLTRVGLTTPHTYPHRLSGGQRQRVAIAAAIACDPDLLIADEPTTALDAIVQAHVLNLLDSLVAERSMAMLLVSHDLGVIVARTERMVVLYAGRAVESGETARILSRRRHPYTRALFAASPHTTTADVPEPIPGSVPALSDITPGCPFKPRCVQASPRCADAMPPLAGEDDHLTACWHPFQ